MSDLKISAVVASAGAGKTTRIVSSIAEQVAIQAPETIVATTFTVKAADELIERARSKLFEAGMPDKAARLIGGRFGTVNAICGQIVAENAIDLGLSPRLEIVPEDAAQRIFAEAAADAIEKHAPELNELAEAFGMFEPKRANDADRSDWRQTVRRIVELARANGISSDQLTRSCDRSAATFESLLPPPYPAGADALDRELRDAVEAAVAEIPSPVSATAKGSIEALQRVAHCFRRDEQITWPDWVRLAKVACAKKDGTAFADALLHVCTVAGRQAEHPRLHEQCSTFIRTVFACAADALEAFQRHKSELGLLDFVDQEALALRALQDQAIAARLREQITALFVDEFQDSSPLQIAVSTELSKLVESTTWVGDPKQAIYGFRNADSALTQAAFKGAAALSDGAQEVLSTSYRSRAGIIDFVNAAFAPALTAMGLDAGEHAFTSAARSDDGFDDSPLSVWWLEGKLELQYDALAKQVREVVNADRPMPVGRKQGGSRPLRPNDIVILCRSREDISKIAGALARRGIQVAVERPNLTRTPHVELVMAAFRWVSDPADTLALAELARLFGSDPQSDAWLTALGEDDAEAALLASIPIAQDLRMLREGAVALTPAELVDAIISIPLLLRKVECWGDLPSRHDDLEALRGVARSYQEGSSGSGTPATATGFVAYLVDQEPKRPRSLREDAVQVMTYHGAKGLEWPMVILTGLAKEPKPRLFEPTAEALGDIDWRNPLADRWIRFWPWPYAGLSKDVPLTDTARASQIGCEGIARTRDEEARLLYVGTTRARDYLVFAPPAKGELHWLAVLNGSGAQHVQLPTAPGEHLHVGGRRFGADVMQLSSDEEVVEKPVELPFVRVASQPKERPPLKLRPSDHFPRANFQVAEDVELGARLPLASDADMQRIGEALHAILAVDHHQQDPDRRRERAQAILDRWGATQISAADALEAKERLSNEVARRWPRAKLYREVPIAVRLGDRLLNGRIDLLVEHANGFAIVDHKSFPGSREQWNARAADYGAQLALYADALQRITPGAACDLFVHMPILGRLVRLQETASDQCSPLGMANKPANATF